jgi:NAD/NADP transhydrogenase alpha subunit
MLMTGRLVAVAVARLVSAFRILGAMVRQRDLRQAVANASRKVKAQLILFVWQITILPRLPHMAA